MGRRTATAARIAAGFAISIVVVIVVAVLLVSRTDFARERVRRIALDVIANSVNGHVSIGRIEGSILNGMTLRDVSIEDSAGAHFLSAHEISLRYALLPVILGRIVLRDVRLVDPVLTLDKPPGGEWNFLRIFPLDTATTKKKADRTGSLVRLDDVTLVNGAIIVRTPWAPADSLDAAGRQAAIDRALATDSRVWITEVTGGYQMGLAFHDLNATLPHIRLAHPDSAAHVFDVANASLTAFLFRPPGARITDLAGKAVLTGDSLIVEPFHVELPSSSVSGAIGYARESGGFRAAFNARKLRFGDLDWLRGDLPEGKARIEGEAFRDSSMVRVIMRHMDVDAEQAKLAGNFDVAIGDGLRIGEGDVSFSNVDTRLIERYAGELGIPDGRLGGAIRLNGIPESLDVLGWTGLVQPDGSESRVGFRGGLDTGRDGELRAETLRLTFEPVRTSLLRALGFRVAAGAMVTGTATIDGPLRGRLDVDADLVHSGGGAGRSRVLARGGVNAIEASVDDLRVRLMPLRVAVLDAAMPELPVGGTLEGDAVLDGSMRGRLTARVDLEHADTTGPSSVAGTVTWNAAPPTPAFDLDLRIDALSLRTVGRFAPEAALRGSANGFLRANGTVDRPAFAFELLTAGSGRMAAEGRLERRGDGFLYDARATLADVDAGMLSARAPHTRLTGRVTVQGQGTDPATARLQLAADLTDVLPDTLTLDSLALRASLADGLARIDRAHLASASAVADLDGTIGVVEGRTGELRYSLVVDSLRDFARFLPDSADTVVARPLLQARRLAAARADSLRLAKATEVERAATGQPPHPALEVDSIAPLKRDSLSGSLRAEGVLSGSVRCPAVSGTARAENLVALGFDVTAARTRYTLVDFGTPDADFAVELNLGPFAASGFAFDSAAAELGYHGIRNRGTGSASLSLFQDPDRDYRMASRFLLELDRREITFSELALRFDSVQWTAPHQSSLAFVNGDVSIDSLELVTDNGESRLRIDGSIPDSGDVDVGIRLQRIQIAQFAALLQDTITATGLLDLDARVAGTRRAPRLEGTTALAHATLDGRSLPDFGARFDYANRQLNATAEVMDTAGPYMTVAARLPVDLALDSVSGSRFYDGPLHVVVKADSLPLEALPGFTNTVSDVRGRIRTDVTIDGTRSNPSLRGFVDLDLASLTVVPLGVPLTDIAGSTRFDGRHVTVDSLRATSDGGAIELSGSIDLATLTRPTFDLALDARYAMFMNNRQGKAFADADLTIAGPLDSTRIEGRARIREGVINIPEAGEKRRYVTLADPSVLAVIDTATTPAGLLPRPNPLLQNLRLDMRLLIDRNVWVRNTDTNAELYTPSLGDPLRIRMNVDQPGLSLEGAINADRGEYSFAGRVFDLTTGSIVFLPGTSTVDPLLQLTANYAVRRPGQEALTITIHVTGSMAKPRVSLESSANPPLPESDLLAYLAFGTSSSGVLSLEGSSLSSGSAVGIGALAEQQIASLAMGAMLDEAVADIERRGTSAGFDIFRIHPADLPAELTYSGHLDNFLRGTEIVLGKYITPRMFVAAEGRTTTEAWPGLRLEYAARGGFSWVTAWESRYLPNRPAFDSQQTAQSTRSLGFWLSWTRRF